VSEATQASQVYALLADGTTVEIRPATPDDFDAVKAMHAAMSPDNAYMRFFNISRVAAEIEARRICRYPTPGTVALLATSGGELAGCASYTALPAESGTAESGTAEVAFAVADHLHHRGIATLLLEHLVSWARQHQLTAFTAATLSENRAMLNVFADAGLPVDRRYADGVYELTFPLPGDDSGTALTATVCGEDFRRCLEALAADPYVDAIIAVVLPTGATGDLVQAIQEADVAIPLAAVVLNQPESVRLLPRPAAGPVPAYGYPEAAVAALARAAAYGAWRAEPRGRVHDFPDITTAKARALTREFLRQALPGGWLAPDQTARLLRCYGIPLAGGEGDRAGTAAPGDGVEVIVRLAADHTFGPLVMVGLGGVEPGSPRTSEVFADSSARLTPLTDADADKLIRSVRSAPLLAGREGRPAAGLGTLRDLLMRVSRLADDLPEVAGLDLDPVIARPDRAVVAAARIKLAPFQPRDPFLRRLR
jgi:GNAT superfamily N-acetyltransferase